MADMSGEFQISAGSHNPREYIQLLGNMSYETEEQDVRLMQIE